MVERECERKERVNSLVARLVRDTGLSRQTRLTKAAGVVVWRLLFFRHFC